MARSKEIASEFKVSPYRQTREPTYDTLIWIGSPYSEFEANSGQYLGGVCVYKLLQLQFSEFIQCVSTMVWPIATKPRSKICLQFLFEVVQSDLIKARPSMRGRCLKRVRELLYTAKYNNNNIVKKFQNVGIDKKY